MGPFLVWINPISHSAYYQAVYCSQQAACKHSYNLTFFCGLFVRNERNCHSSNTAVGWISAIHKYITNPCRKLFSEKKKNKFMTRLQNTHKRLTNMNFPEWSMASPQQREEQDKLNRQWTVLKQQATVPERALKGSFIASYQMACTENHTLSVKIQFCPVLKTLLLKYWGTRLLGKLIQYNSAQTVARHRICHFYISTFVGAHT